MVDDSLEARYEDILRVLREIVAPLVEADGGQLYLIPAEELRVAIHLTGRHMGSPGIGLLGRRIVEPALRIVTPDLPIVLTTGWKIPAGAIRVEPKHS